MRTVRSFQAATNIPVTSTRGRAIPGTALLVCLLGCLPKAVPMQPVPEATLADHHQLETAVCDEIYYTLLNSTPAGQYPVWGVMAEGEQLSQWKSCAFDHPTKYLSGPAERDRLACESTVPMVFLFFGAAPIHQGWEVGTSMAAPGGTNIAGKSKTPKRSMHTWTIVERDGEWETSNLVHEHSESAWYPDCSLATQQR